MVIRLVKKGQFWVGSRVVKRGQSRVVISVVKRGYLEMVIRVVKQGQLCITCVTSNPKKFSTNKTI